MSNLVIDTHAAVWYFAKSPNMSLFARNDLPEMLSTTRLIMDLQ